MPKILMVIAPKNFRDEELFVPKEFFESKKIAVDVASTVKTPVHSMRGRAVTPNLKISEIVFDDYDSVVFVGGIGVDDERLYENKEYVDLAKKAYLKGKIVAAICIAPKILASAGILKNKKVTVFSSGMEYIRSKGATVSTQDVVQDGMIITASGPNAARKFAETIYNMLSS
jgi:protease I